MNKLFLLPIALILFIKNNSVAQTSKKEVMSHRQQIYKLDTLAIKSGKYLEFAETFSVKAFVEYYVEYGKEMFTKKEGLLTIEELYEDSDFTYFGRKDYYGLIKFFKVTTSELSQVNYEELDGAPLRKRFIDEVVPESDKQRVAKKDKNCSMGYYYTDFDYTYYPGTKELKISYTWKINCEFLYKIINKVYTAKYNLDSKQFTK